MEYYYVDAIADTSVASFDRYCIRSESEHAALAAVESLLGESVQKLELENGPGSIVPDQMIGVPDNTPVLIAADVSAKFL